MGAVTTDQLKRVIESQHGGKASFLQSMKIPAPKGKLTEWDGIVHVFDMKDHPKTKRAYAWSSSIKGGTKPRYFAVLHGGRINSPVDAIRAAAAAIRSTVARSAKV